MSVEEFIEYYNMLGRKISKPYYYLLKGFEEWLSSKGKKIGDFTPNDVEVYMAVLAKSSPRSANLFLSAIRKYAEWRVRNSMNNASFLKEERRVWALKGIRMRKVPREIKKEALSIDELKRVLTVVRYNPMLAVGTIIHFYFGWRPVEGASFISNAKIFWNENYMIIKTAKVGNERILPWAPKVTPYVRAWFNFAKSKLSSLSRPEEWYTKAIKPVGKRLGITITARTARKTFETHMRKAGVDQWAINSILGHTTTVPDVYTDWDEVREYLSSIMTNKHYLLPLLEEVEFPWLKKTSQT